MLGRYSSSDEAKSALLEATMAAALSFSEKREKPDMIATLEGIAVGCCIRSLPD